MHTFYPGHIISFIGFVCWSTYTIFSCARAIDKFVHTGICALMTLIFLLVCSMIGIPWWYAPLGALAVGIWKEFKDLFNPKKRLFDWWDLIADLAGISVIVWIYVFSFIYSGFPT